METKVCEECGEVFERGNIKPSRWNEKKYCGRVCSAKATAKKSVGTTYTVQERASTDEDLIPVVTHVDRTVHTHVSMIPVHSLIDGPVDTWLYRNPAPESDDESV